MGASLSAEVVARHSGTRDCKREGLTSRQSETLIIFIQKRKSSVRIKEMSSRKEV